MNQRALARKYWYLNNHKKRKVGMAVQEPMVGYSVKGKLKYVTKHDWFLLRGPIPPAEFDSNACTFSPDKVGPYDHSVACHWHDWHYNSRSGVPRNREGREYADDVFRDNIQFIMERQGANFRARARAWIYYKAVRRHGAVAFYKDGFPEDDKPPYWQFTLAFKLLKKII